MGTAKKGHGSENSVITALEELCEMENERVAAEAARHEAARLEAAREEARRSEECRLAEERERVAAEAKARVEAELRRQGEEAEARLDRLRAELAAVRADREMIRMEILSRLSRPKVERSRPWFLIAAALVASVALGGVFVSLLEPGDGQATEPEVAASTVGAVEPEPAAVEPEPAAVEPEPVVARPDRKPDKPARPPKPPKPPVADWTSDLAGCDDPMGCGDGRRPIL